MRVSTAQLSAAGLSNILNQQSKLNETQSHLSSGLRIRKPSDDPSGATRALGFKSYIGQIDQYQSNIDVAQQYIDLEETALASVISNLQRVRELAIQGNNDSQSDSSRDLIADEVAQQLEELLALANTQNANGEFIFSGYQGKTQPFTRGPNNTFVYNGDQGQRYLQVSSSRQIATSDSGSDVFLRLKTGNGTFATSGSSANTGSGLISPGVVSDASAVDGDRYNVLFPNSTTAGAAVTFSDVVGTNDNLGYALQINGTTVYSVNEAGTPINSLSDLAQQINLSTGTTNVKAYVDGGVLYLGNTPTSSNDIVVNESLSGFTPGDGDTLTGYFGSALTEASASNNITLTASDATRYLVEDSRGNIDASGVYQDGGNITFNGHQVSIEGTPQTSDSFTVAPSANQSLFTTVQNLVDALRNGDSTSTNFHNVVSSFLSDVDIAEESMISARSNLGSRQNALESQKNLNEDSLLRFKQTVSDIEDLDFAQAISELNLQTVGLQAAQKAYLRVQNLSLFNFLN